MAAALGTPLVALFGLLQAHLLASMAGAGRGDWAGDFGSIPDPDDSDTSTNERFLDLIPTDAVIAAAKKVLA